MRAALEKHICALMQRDLPWKKISCLEPQKKKETTIIYRIRWALAGHQGHSVSVSHIPEHHMRHTGFNLKTESNLTVPLDVRMYACVLAK